MEYYFSNTGDDNNAGTKRSPWKSLEKFYSSVKLQPGTKVFFERGGIWNGQLWLTLNGLPNNKIMIGAYGNGPKLPVIRARFNNSGAWEETNYPGVWKLVTDHQILFRQFFIQDKPIRLAWHPHNVAEDQYLKELSKSKDYLFGPGRRSTVQYVKVPANLTPAEFSALKPEGFADAIVVRGANSVLENLGLEACISAVNAYNADWLTFRNLVIKDCLSIGIYLRGTQGPVSNCVVSQNVFDTTGNDAIYVLNGDCNRIISNNIKKVTDKVLGKVTSGDQAGIGLESSRSTLVEGNVGSDIKGTAVDYHFDEGSVTRKNYFENLGVGAISPSGRDILVYSNIFNVNWNSGASGVARGVNVSTRGKGRIGVFHNIIFGLKGHALFAKTEGAEGEINVRNNIFVHTSTDAVVHCTYEGPGKISSDNNLYWLDYCPENGSRPPRWANDMGVINGHYVFKVNGKYFRGFEELRANSTLEINSLYAEPKFKGNPCKAQRPEQFKLTPNSPGVNKGEDVESAGLMKLKKQPPCLNESGIPVLPTDQPYVDYEGEQFASGALDPSIGSFVG